MYSWLSLNQNTNAGQQTVISSTQATLTTTEYNNDALGGPIKNKIDKSQEKEWENVTIKTSHPKIIQITDSKPTQRTILSDIKNFFQSKATISMIVIISLVIIISSICAYFVILFKSRKNKYKVSTKVDLSKILINYTTIHMRLYLLFLFFSMTLGQK